MRIRIQRRGLVPALLVTVVGVFVLYLGSTWGWAQLQAAGSASTGVGTLPDVVESPPSSVGTTAAYGPLGSVSMVYAGTDVRDGLFDEVSPVWLAVSAHDGDTRALSAPGLPQPGAGRVSVSPAGDQLAWVDGTSVAVYDTSTDQTRTFAGVEASAVGAFSPDGTELLVAADGVTVVDLGSGDPVARVEIDPEALPRAVWQPDGRAVELVDGGDLVTAAVPGGEVSRQPTRIPERSQLAWAGSGDRLVSLQPAGGARRLFVSPVTDGGRVGTPQLVETPQVSLERLVGPSGSNSVAVVAYALESGAVERVLDVPLGGGSPSNLTTLPAPGENWVDSSTMAIATDTLPFGSTDFDDHVWPWSHTARLGACVLLGLFLFGLFVTRRPRH